MKSIKKNFLEIIVFSLVVINIIDGDFEKISLLNFIKIFLLLYCIILIVKKRKHERGC